MLCYVSPLSALCLQWGHKCVDTITSLWSLVWASRKWMKVIVFSRWWKYDCACGFLCVLARECKYQQGSSSFFPCSFPFILMFSSSRLHLDIALFLSIWGWPCPSHTHLTALFLVPRCAHLRMHRCFRCTCIYINSICGFVTVRCWQVWCSELEIHSYPFMLDLHPSWFETAC